MTEMASILCTLCDGRDLWGHEISHFHYFCSSHNTCEHRVISAIYPWAPTQYRKFNWWAIITVWSMDSCRLNRATSAHISCSLGSFDNCDFCWMVHLFRDESQLTRSNPFLLRVGLVVDSWELKVGVSVFSLLRSTSDSLNIAPFAILFFWNYESN